MVASRSVQCTLCIPQNERFLKVCLVFKCTFLWLEDSSSNFEIQSLSTNPLLELGRCSSPSLSPALNLEFNNRRFSSAFGVLLTGNPGHWRVSQEMQLWLIFIHFEFMKSRHCQSGGVTRLYTVTKCISQFEVCIVNLQCEVHEKCSFLIFQWRFFTFFLHFDHGYREMSCLFVL